jgi:hypothetical protein
MAAQFIPEDGTGLANANSYVVLAFADQYFLDRAVTTWTGADAIKQSALVRATDYVEGRFGPKFLGCSFSETQSLFFPTASGLTNPTTGVLIPDPLPVKLLKAICEYAMRALTVTLAPDPTTDATGQRVQATVEQVGPIQESITYAPGGTIFVFKPYPAADMLLKGLYRTTGGTLRN